MTVRRFAIAVIVAVCLGAPVAEMFDQWDRTLQDGNDTEADVIIVALCVGVALAAAGVVVAKIRAMSARSSAYVSVFSRVRVTTSSFASPIPTSSPPTPLRV